MLHFYAENILSLNPHKDSKPEPYQILQIPGTVIMLYTINIL